MNDLQEEIVDGSSDILEFGIDLLTKNEILKEFPILGTAIKIGLSIKSISDRAFLKKIEKFLLKFDEASAKEKNKIFDLITLDEKKRNIIGENLFFLIDRFSDRDKPELLARLFVLYLKDIITLDDFVRLGNAIDLSFSPDLHAFISEPNNINVLRKLTRSGLTEVSSVGAIPTEQIGMMGGMAISHPIIITELGKVFLKLNEK